MHLVEKCSSIPFDVKRNDEITVQQAAEYDKIMLSPGPGLPAEAGIMPQLVYALKDQKSILGVCLGHQAVGEAFGCKLKNLPKVYHGIATEIDVIKDHLLFQNCPARFKVGRYHSWVIDPLGLSDSIEVTAIDDQKNIMAVRHKEFNVCGVQFHPESILSEYGETIISNWLKQ